MPYIKTNVWDERRYTATQINADRINQYRRVRRRNNAPELRRISANAIQSSGCINGVKIRYSEAIEEKGYLRLTNHNKQLIHSMIDNWVVVI